MEVDMRRVSVLMFVLLVAIMFVSSGFAQEKPSAGEKQAVALEKPAKEKAKREKGEVISTSPAEKTLVVRGNQGEKTYTIAENVKLKVYKAFDEIKVGEQVVVRYVEREGKKIALAIGKYTHKLESKE
jgi:hypothetical protein